MEVRSYSDGQIGAQDVDPSFLGDKVKTRTLKAAVLMYQANKRAGTHDTLTRGEVSMTKKQRFRQKGLGRGRVRHGQVPQCRGGGVAHGPHPRDYSYSMPRKARRVALRSALLSKFRDEEVSLLDLGEVSAPKTKVVASALRELGIEGSALIVAPKHDKTLYLSVRNLPRVTLEEARNLNAHDVLRHRALVLLPGALEAMQEVCGDA